MLLKIKVFTIELFFNDFVQDLHFWNGFFYNLLKYLV